MIDLTPLDVRKKGGDLPRVLRGYSPEAVDDFLELVAERLEDVLRENASLREKSTQLTEQLAAYRDREQALNDALITAQTMREELRTQSTREAELALREARAEAERVLADAHRQVETAQEAARRFHAARVRYVRGFRAFVERQMEEIEGEEERLRQMTRPAAGSGAAAAPGQPGSSPG
jgi:DivIVA domain-containing protein